MTLYVSVDKLAAYNCMLKVTKNDRLAVSTTQFVDEMITKQLLFRQKQLV
ncbi:hypothetical protein [Paraglaciecola chathamensis]|nr:hypothetical protein GCHA_3284 [Paraglaciecola chathamensis S18K6]